ncbi:unnamed protein product (macronuclear) [Paramecium tetraurelia]|uniref:phosphoinositide 5-phosphatase n=1 Tax=Paramecium tetraurelia TaxID=5888 RepID=A0DJB5_PARTE|nr:uncharacterized protein GSPATT00017476001 [Paramecium tetraurelia]CAK83132.1 unnamed protein product [Paramecium tetraurelia]|eukprot:XP_001450529.1 hypothetical protein (macronuclear) [Paramecium tetraurelia strain d4-2]
MFKSQFLNNFTILRLAQRIIINANEPSLGLQTVLIIDNQTGNIFEQQEAPQIEGEVCLEEIQASSILGIYQGQLQKYLIVCKKCELVAQVLKQKYYRIQSVGFIGFQFCLDKKMYQDEYGQMQSIKEYLSNHFYFSYNGNPAQPLQSYYTNNYRDFSEFLWNNHLTNKFQDYDIQPQWYCKMIQGYVGQFQSKLGNEQIKYILISRKCRYQSGTRFHHRGINDDGYVANYVATEFIVMVKGFCISHVIYRGSVPTFWKQKGITGQVKITRNEQLCVHAYLKHFNDLQECYKNISCINLMGENTSESTLNEAFKSIVEKNQIDGVILVRIDFHKICKNEKFKQIDNYIRGSDDKSIEFDCFALNTVNQQIMSLQQGSYRVNCLDCLDRTNAYQSRLCLRITDLLLVKYQVNHDLDLLYMIEDTKACEFLNQYRVIWAENGDAISQLYCGTNATTSEFTKKGKTTFKGFFTHNLASIGRLFNQTFIDSTKNQIIESYLHGIQNQRSSLQIYLQSQVKSYCKFQKFKLFALTWNVNGNLILNLQKDVLEFHQDYIPDFIVISLQEIQQYKAHKIIGQNQDIVNEWIKSIESSINMNGKQFCLVQQENLVGMLILIYSKVSLVQLINKISTDRIKTGLEGHSGNKGACLIRFQIKDSQIAVCNCHLASGYSKNKRRMESLEEIHEKAFKNQMKPLDSSDYTLLMGDMNFRLNSNQATTLDLIEQQKQAEQSYEAKAKYPLQEYQEACITFLPTYKLNANHTYQTKKQEQIPSYCDRIFIKTNEQALIKQLFYKSIERFDSDHLPVTAMFIIDVKTIDKEKEANLIKEFTQKSNQLEEEENTIEEQQKQEKSATQKSENKKGIFQQFKDKFLK